MSARRPTAEFEALYAATEDPWGFASDPYEQRKYDDTLAALGPGRFGRALELGCAIGVLTQRLADRCDALVALDGAPTAAARARERLRDSPHVEIVTGLIPEDVPAGPWDLVVASEILYYLGPELLDETLARVVGGLVTGGLLLAVHWTGEAASHPQHADAIHARLRAAPGLRHLDGGVRDAGYRLDLLERIDP